jgi:uncharacterized membrane protein
LASVLAASSTASSFTGSRSGRNLQIDTLLDGLFPAATYVFVVAGLAILWRHAHRIHVRCSTKLLAGMIASGWYLKPVGHGGGYH